MKKINNLAVLTILLSVIFANLCGSISSYAYDGNDCPKHHLRGGLLKESVSDLKESGALTEDDVNNIKSYMTKERENKEAEIKEKIYKNECEKIDKMVSEKVITKEKGEKLKASVKENLENMKKDTKKLNSK